MPLNINKYMKKKKRTCLDFFRYRYIKHEHWCKLQYAKNRKRKTKEYILKPNTEKLEEQKKIEKWRDEIAKNKQFPTAENISICIYPQIYNILLYFFPNSFKTDKEAYDYYKNFCERAKNLGEDEPIYKCGELLNKGIAINITLDMLSGQKIIWNSFYKSPYSIYTLFNFFSYEDIKNETLKKEIEQLYIDNWEFLEEIGMCYKFSSGDLSIHSMLDITPYGIDYITSYAGYNEFQVWFGKHHDIFQLPVDNIICAFRECYTYYLKEEECGILKEKINLQSYKDISRCELDFKRKHAEIANKFIHIFLDIEYFRSAEIITNYKTGRPYRYIDPFIMHDCYKS